MLDMCDVCACKIFLFLFHGISVRNHRREYKSSLTRIGMSDSWLDDHDPLRPIERLDNMSAPITYSAEVHTR